VKVPEYVRIESRRRVPSRRRCGPDQVEHATAQAQPSPFAYGRSLLFRIATSLSSPTKSLSDRQSAIQSLLIDLWTWRPLHAAKPGVQSRAELFRVRD